MFLLGVGLCCATVTEFLEQYQYVQKDNGNIQSSSEELLGSALFSFMCWWLGVGESAYSLVLWSRM